MSGQITIVQNPISPTLRLKLHKAPKNPSANGPENQQPVTIDAETLSGLLKIADKHGNLKVNITANGHITNGAEHKSNIEPSIPPRKKNKKKGRKGQKLTKMDSYENSMVSFGSVFNGYKLGPEPTGATSVQLVQQPQERSEPVTETLQNDHKVIGGVNDHKSSASFATSHVKSIFDQVEIVKQPEPPVRKTKHKDNKQTIAAAEVGVDKRISDEVEICERQNEEETPPVVSQLIILSEPLLYGNADTGAFALMKKEFEEKEKLDKTDVAVITSLQKLQQADMPSPLLRLTTTIPLSPSSQMRHASVFGVPKQTRYVTTLFEVTGNRLAMFLSDIEEELKFWTGRELVICCEVYWSQPATNSRNRQLEHSIRSAVNRPMIAAKYQLAKRLQLHSVPSSITEESSSSGGMAVSGVEVGIYRQFTPRLVEQISQETTDRHADTWAFDPHQTPVEKLLKSHGAEEMRKNSILAVNLVTLEF